MSLLSCKNISVSYENFKALQNISFKIEAGDYICIIGENGSGKSTLLKSLLQLIPLKSGNIILGDGLSRNEIGYLPQQSQTQKNFPASIYEVVISGTLPKKKIFPFYTNSDRKIATKWMKKLGIEELKHKHFSALSGGQQQRVLLARALCATEKLLIVDEPTTGLDPVVTKDFYKLLHKLNVEEHITIIMTSHDINVALKHSNKILHLKNNLLFFGRKEDYLNSEIGKNFIGGIHNA